MLQRSLTISVKKYCGGIFSITSAYLAQKPKTHVGRNGRKPF
jgi:hypothetical protein